MKTIKLEKLVHNNQPVVSLIFEKDQSLIDPIRSVKGIKWSKSKKMWYIFAHEFELQDFVKIFKGIAYINYSEILKSSGNVEIREKEAVKKAEPITGENLEKFKKWLLYKRYSPNTIRTYTDAIKTFLIFFKRKGIVTIGNDEIIMFVNDYLLRNNYSFSYQNQIINAIKIYYKEIEKSEIEISKIERPRNQRKLPNVLSIEEVERILKVCRNLKHKVAPSVIYACGLRRSELLNLKPSDIDSKRNILTIRNAKGYKDRVVPISDKLIEILRKYYIEYRPKVWLFEGMNAGTKYSAESLQQVFKGCVKKSGLSKPATLHWLRHSYATHLLENGTDLRYIQELLGHKSSRTTEIYTHVSNKELSKIRTPFEQMNI
jgi:integrase/recombinase XerD